MNSTTTYSLPSASLTWWQRLLTWTAVLGAFILLGHFFSTIFITFILSYIMRSLVVALAKRAPRSVPARVAEPGITVICYIRFVLCVYRLGGYIGPRLIMQAQNLVARIAGPSASSERRLDTVLRDTLGHWLLYQRFGASESPELRIRFNSFLSAPPPYDEFVEYMDDVNARFLRDLSERGLITLPSSFGDEQLFRSWVQKTQIESYLSSSRGEFEAAWEADYADAQYSFSGLPPLLSLSPSAREESLRRHATAQLLADDVRREELRHAWESHLLSLEAEKMRLSKPEQYAQAFDNFYESLKEVDGAHFSFSSQSYLDLVASYKRSIEEFQQLFQTLYKSPERREQDEKGLYALFLQQQRLSLVKEWEKGDLARKLEGRLEEYAVTGMSWLGGFLRATLQRLAVLPFELGLVLLLSLFIVIDLPRLARGAQRLRQSRLSAVYDELAPSVVSFARLIGRAFQAQAVIALVNTALTFGIIKFLGIQNEVFLCTIVFLCSFIPVVGVVISGVPIAMVALAQDGGGFVLALWAVVGILLVHFIETSMLNPKIVGEMLHLHPVFVLTILAIGEHFFGVWGLLLGVPVVVYVVRFVIFDDGIPGMIEPVRRRKPVT